MLMQIWIWIRYGRCRCRYGHIDADMAGSRNWGVLLKGGVGRSGLL